MQATTTFCPDHINELGSRFSLVKLQMQPSHQDGCSLRRDLRSEVSTEGSWVPNTHNYRLGGVVVSH